MTTLFVDGSHGTVGLALQPHLDQLQAEGLITQAPPLPEEHRKDTAARDAAYRNADLVVLCLPDALAADAAALALSVNPNVRILDASAAHRCQSTWLYGLPELPAIRRKDFRNAQLVANPGCFATARPQDTRAGQARCEWPNSACLTGTWPRLPTSVM